MGEDGAARMAPMNAIHRLVGMGGDQLVAELLGRDSPAARDRHRHHYADLRAETCAFPGARDLLRALHDHGVTVVLATSAQEDDLEQARKPDANKCFDAVTTGGDGASSKPAPDIFEAGRRAGGIDRHRCLALGDSVWDVRAARAAGMGCVGVETGGFSRHELSEAGAVAVYRDVAEVLAQLEVGPLGRICELARAQANRTRRGSMAS